MTPSPGNSTSPRRYSDQEAAEELRRNPGVRQTSQDPYEATHQTVEYMAKLVWESLPDGIVQDCVPIAVRYANLAAGNEWAAIWWWVRDHLQFIHHSKMLGAWVGMPDELQLLIRPDALLKMQSPKGDCAVYTTLVCAMLECAGYEWEIVTVAVDPNQPGIFSHVYARVILPNGARVALDASHGTCPGWEAPPERVTAKQVWDCFGQPVEDLDTGFRGLHGMGEAYMYPGMGHFGLGQDDGTDVEDEYGGATTGTSATSSTVSTSTSTSFPVTSTGNLTLNCPGDPGCPGTTLPITSSSGSGSGTVVIYSNGAPTTSATSSETQALNSLASQFANIFGATQGVSTITKNANGSYSMTLASGQSTTSSSIAGLLGSGSGVGNILLWGGIIVAAFLIIGAIEGHR